MPDAAVPDDAVSDDAVPDDAVLVDVVARWAGGAEVVRGWAWPHGESRVLLLRTALGDVVAKGVARAAAFDQELTAMRRYAPALGDGAAQLRHADPARSVLVLTAVAGELAEGSAAEVDPDVHRQAGALTARLHRSAPPIIDEHWGATLRSRFESWGTRAAGLVTAAELARVAELVGRAGALGPVELVPAHRDNGPRNWLVDDGGRVRLIDFGHCRRAPWVEDLHRMTWRQWRERPALRDAFLDGYGRHPDEHDLAVLAAHDAVAVISTIVWAVAHGDAPFAELGRAELARLTRA